MMKQITNLILWVCLFYIPTISQALSGGATLTEPLGARQAAMGESHTALSGDIYALHYNVAGIADVQTPALSSMYATTVFNDSNAFLIFGMPAPFPGKGALAISVLNYIGDEIEINRLDGSSKTIQSQNDIVGTLGYAVELAPRFFIGASVKLFQSTLAEEYNAFAVGTDIGVLIKNIGLTGFNIGAAIQNSGTEIKYENQGDPMPTLQRIGVAYETTLLNEHGIKLTIDSLFPNDHDPYQHLGIEYNWKKTLFLRAGYKLNYDIDSFTLGAGILYYGIKLDYAFSSFTTGGNAHRIGLGYMFGNL